MTFGFEMKKPQYFENLITTTPRTTTSVALGDPFPGPKVKKTINARFKIHDGSLVDRKSF